MPIWTNTYKTVPQSYKNPGQGAFHFRDLKEAVEERETPEHIWGQDETTLTLTGGLHKEGASRVFSKDGGESLRPTEERVSSNKTRIGRLTFDSTPLSTLRKQNDVNITNYKDQRTQKIQIEAMTIDGTTGIPVNAADPDAADAVELVTIYDRDTLVDREQDQTIDGIKKFDLHAQVPVIVESGETVHEAWEDYINTPPTTDLGSNAAVTIAETYELTEEARAFNIFDSDNDENTTIVDTSEDTYGKVVAAEIRSAYIYGTEVHGAVWA